MSDYGGDDTDEDFTGYADEEFDIEEGFFDPDAVVNGHDKDEEDVRQSRLEDDFEKVEGQETEGREEKEDEESDEELEDEEEIISKTVSRVVASGLRKTNPILTKFEYSYLISQRAMAIENNSPLMYIETKYIHSIDIAKEETIMGLNPIIIQRVLPNGDIEEWKSSELKLPKSYQFN
jgi:hypothetical protein